MQAAAPEITPRARHTMSRMRRAYRDFEVMGLDSRDRLVVAYTSDHGNVVLLAIGPSGNTWTPEGDVRDCPTPSVGATLHASAMPAGDPRFTDGDRTMRRTRKL